MVSKIPRFEIESNMDWKLYQQQLKFHFQANGIEDKVIMRAAFLSSCSFKTYSALHSIVQPEELERIDFDILLTTFGRHFSPDPSRILERYKFNRRDQLSEESIVDYVANLKKMSEFCRFGASLDELLCDRLVCGVKDSVLRKRLLAELDLTLKSAVNIAIAHEQALLSENTLMSGSKDGSSLLMMGNKRTSEMKHANSGKKILNIKKFSCFACGGFNHTKAVCKFRNYTCNRCKLVGHLAKVCKGKTVGDSRYKLSQGSPERNYSLFSVSSEENVHIEDIDISLNNCRVVMGIDSGCSKSIIGTSTAKKIWPDGICGLKPTDVVLKTWSGQSVKLLGKTTVSVSVGNLKVDLPILVAVDDGPSLLGRNWFDAMQIKVFCGVLAHRSTVNYVTDQVIIEKFKDIFGKPSIVNEDYAISIDMSKDASPIFCKARPVPLALRPRMELEIHRLVNEGILTETKFSSWATPVVPVVKDNGSIRLCGDYSATLNRFLLKDHYPLPTSSELMTKLSDCKIFTKLDLRNAYQQLPVKEEFRKLLTINTMKGLFVVNCLPFGISSASSIFQRFMENLLCDIAGVAVYQDDVLIAAPSSHLHAERLSSVFARLRSAGLSLRREKCVFSAESVKFLGYKLDSVGIHPLEDKLKSISQAPVPRDKKQLQSFLGLYNFYSRFVRNRSTLLEPLHRLLDKGSVWKWSGEHEVAFRKAKDALSRDVSLAHFVPSLPLRLTCDASDYGVGAVLTQVDERGVEKPLCFSSRTLSKAERNYGQIDKEALAIVYAVKKFHIYLYGVEFQIVTDHKPLLGLLASDRAIPLMLSPRMVRWKLLLAAYKFKLLYKPGKAIVVADALSRLPLCPVDEVCVDSNEVLMLDSSCDVPLDFKKIAFFSRRDPIIARVYSWVLAGSVESSLPATPEFATW